MASISHLGQYWCAERGEIRLLGASELSPDLSGGFEGTAVDLSDISRLPRHRFSFRRALRGRTWREVSWTYSSLPCPLVELVDQVEASGHSVTVWAREVLNQAGGIPRRLDLAALDRDPDPAVDHLVAPVIPRRAQAFGVTYLNSALERESEGARGDYSYVYRAVKDRGERPELFVKATHEGHVVGPRGRMGLRRDLTNSETADGASHKRLVVSAGIEPELAAVVHSNGRVWGYTLADDVSGNRLENETLLYLYQAKHFTGSLVLGPLIMLSGEQRNPRLDIVCRILSPSGEKVFERATNSERINAPISTLIAWAASHVRLTPGEVFCTGTDVVPEGEVKVLEEGHTVEIGCPDIGILRHGAAPVPEDGALNLDYSRLEFETPSHGK